MPVDTIAPDAASRLVDPWRAGRASIAGRLGARHLGLVVKLGVSVGLIALVCRNIDVAALADHFGGQSAVWLGATVVLGLVQIALLGLRWQQILKGLGGETSLRSALTVTFMGCFFGAFLFGPTGGDVARAVLAPTRSLGRRTIVHSVLFERLASMIGLGIAAIPPVLLSNGPLTHSLPVVAALAVAPVTLLAIVVATGLARGLGGRAGAMFLALRELDHDWRRLARAWPLLAVAVAIAAAGQGLVAAEAWCLAQAQHLGVPFSDFAILMPAVMLAVALPISAGGWGVREGAIVAALALAGVGTAPALLLSIELGVIGTLVSLPGGAMWCYRWLSRPGSGHDTQDVA